VIDIIETVSALLLATIMVGLAVYIISTFKKSHLHYALAGIIISLMLHLISNYIADNSKIYELAYFFTQSAVFLTAIPITLFLYISYIFPYRRKKLNLKQKLLLFIPLGIIGALNYTPLNITYLEIQDWGVYFEPGPLYLIFLFILFIPQLGTAILNFANHFKDSTSVETKQITYIVKGWIFCAFLGLTTQMILPVFFNFPQSSVVGPYLMDFFLVTPMVYSLTRYRFFDLKLIMKNAFLYTSIFISYTAFALLNLYTFQINIFLFFINISLLIFGIFYFKQIYLKLNNLWNILFYRSFVNYDDFISQFNGSNLTEFLSLFKDNLRTLFGINEVSFLAVNDGQANSLSQFIPIHYTDNDELFSWIDGSHEVYVNDEIEYMRKIGELNEEKILNIKKELERFYAEIAVPVSTPDGEFLGIVLLGGKNQKQVFYKQEIEKIKILINEIVLYLYKLRHFENSESRIAGNINKNLLHNINTPLTIAHNQAEMLTWDETDKEKLAKLSKIKKNIKKASNALKEHLNHDMIGSRSHTRLKKPYKPKLREKV
jgi:hypothetical protein